MEEHHFLETFYQTFVNTESHLAPFSHQSCGIFLELPYMYCSKDLSVIPGCKDFLVQYSLTGKCQIRQGLWNLMANTLQSRKDPISLLKPCSHCLARASGPEVHISVHPFSSSPGLFCSSFSLSASLCWSARIPWDGVQSHFLFYHPSLKWIGLWSSFTLINPSATVNLPLRELCLDAWFPVRVVDSDFNKGKKKKHIN